MISFGLVFFFGGGVVLFMLEVVSESAEQLQRFRKALKSTRGELIHSFCYFAFGA
jgi:hypothetical protein